MATAASYTKHLTYCTGVTPAICVCALRCLLTTFYVIWTTQNIKNCPIIQHSRTTKCQKIEQNGPAPHFHHAPAAPVAQPSRPAHRAVPKSATIPSIGSIVQVSIPLLPTSKTSLTTALIRELEHLHARCATYL